jgi:hypothetical protein
VVRTVAVVAHSGKTLQGGLSALRDELASAGVVDPLWFAGVRKPQDQEKVEHSEPESKHAAEPATVPS